MKPKRIAAVPALALLVAACGATPPQAPPKQAMKLSVATSGISTACGLSYQATAFPGNHSRDLAALEKKVSLSVEKLASVYARNEAWIYQGETVHDIVRDALSMLGSCGLTKAQSALARASRNKRS